MNKTLRNFGVFIMVISGMPIISMLVSMPYVMRQTGRPFSELLPTYLLLFLLFAAVFFAGFAVFRKYRKEPAAKKIYPAPDTRESASAPETKQTGDPGKVILYRHPCPEKAIDQNPNVPVLAELTGEFRNGVPLVSTGYYEPSDGTALWNTESHPVPEAMQPRLILDSLQSWILENFRYASEIPFWRMENTQMIRWCGMVREHCGLGMFDFVGNPFEERLSDVGKDGLYDRSGVGLWLKLRNGQNVSEAIRVLAQKDHDGVAVVLTEDPHVLDGVSESDRKLAAENGIWFGLMTGKDSIKDLVTGAEYGLASAEYPGSADDAATYGEWELHEKKAPKPSAGNAAGEAVQEPVSEDAADTAAEEKLREMKALILADCRELGVDDETYSRWEKSDMWDRRESGEAMTFTYDPGSGKYTIEDHEKGKVSGGISSSDPLDFRFRFLQTFILKARSTKDPKRRAETEEFMAKTREKFSGTAFWQVMLSSCKNEWWDFLQPADTWGRLILEDGDHHSTLLALEENAFIGLLGFRYYLARIDGKTYPAQFGQERQIELLSCRPISENTRPYEYAEGFITPVTPDELDDFCVYKLAADYRGDCYPVQMVSGHFKSLTLSASRSQYETARAQGFRYDIKDSLCEASVPLTDLENLRIREKSILSYMKANGRPPSDPFR